MGTKRVKRGRLSCPIFFFIIIAYTGDFIYDYVAVYNSPKLIIIIIAIITIVMAVREELYGFETPKSFTRAVVALLHVYMCVRQTLYWACWCSARFPFPPPSPTVVRRSYGLMLHFNGLCYIRQYHVIMTNNVYTHAPV